MTDYQLLDWIDKISSFGSLENGWDSYDADPPNTDSRYRSGLFLFFLLVKDDYLGGKVDLNPCRVEASAMGGVAITLKHDTKKAFIEFYNTGSVHCLLSDDSWNWKSPVVWDQMQTFPVTDYNQAIKRIKEFLYGTQDRKATHQASHEPSREEASS